MIILSILLIALLLLISLVVIECIFKPKWIWLNRVTAVILIIGIVAGLASGVASWVCGARISDLKAKSAMLTPYYNLIVETNDEHARFDYYQRVVEYNTEYENCLEGSKDPWIGAFYPQGWDSEISLIDFTLRTGYDNEMNDYEDFFDDEVLDGDPLG
jgi:hypothetical protein